MTQESTAAVRPVPWDGSFIPLPPHLCQPSQPLEAETISSFLCERCHAFAKWHESKRKRMTTLWRQLIMQPIQFKIPCIPLWWLVKERSFDLYQNWNDFYASYEQGCHLCSIVFSCLNVETNHASMQSWSFASNAVRLKLKYSDWMMYVVPEVCTSPPLKFEALFDCIVLQNEKRMPSLSAMSIATCSTSTLRLATTWIRNCTDSHPNCSKQFDPSFVPTRLIAIMEESGNRIVKLEKTKPGPFIRPYVALSYCWGGEVTAKLLSHNVEQFSSQGIPINQLPKTMQHAIDLTPHLGWQRIWIDALCIIQDNDDDWKHEAGRMADVYANSALTIAAWGASSSDQGLFTVRDPLLVASCKLYEVSNTNTSMFAIPTGKSRIPCEVSDASRSPLYTRGWVVQERLFAPRTLNVGPFVSWECKTGTCSELQPELKNVAESVKTIFDAAEQEDGVSSEGGRMIKTWNEDVVSSFTAARLTRKSDRLVAISGAIQRLSNERDWKNIQGLWEPFLISQLQWRTGEINRSSPWSSERNGAGPSWSWTSIDGPVCYRDREQDRQYSRVLLAEHFPTMSQTNGQRVSEQTSLALKGHLYELVLLRQEIKSRVLDVKIRGQGRTESWHVWKDLSNTLVGTPCWFLLLSTYVLFSERHVSGLALIKVTDTPAKYERIGLVDGPMKYLSSKLRREFDKDPTHEITII